MLTPKKKCGLLFLKHMEGLDVSSLISFIWLQKLLISTCQTKESNVM